MRSKSNIPGRPGGYGGGNYATIGNSPQTSRVSRERNQGRNDNNYSNISLPKLNRGGSYQSIQVNDIEDHLI
jgi:hypothetical protein